MIISELKNGNTLVVKSDCDSGRHLGFRVSEQSSYGNFASSDKLLTKEQILRVETMISYMVGSYVKDNDKHSVKHRSGITNNSIDNLTW